jgi:hypothetical protein
MAVDATKLRRGVRKLGEPPTDSNPELSERSLVRSGAPSGTMPPVGIASLPVTAPEHASPPLYPPRPPIQPPLGTTGGGQYIDGRTRRRTGRIEQINVKVSSQFNSDLRGLADREGLLIVEVLERALDTYLRVIAAAGASGQTVGQLLDGLSRR